MRVKILHYHRSAYGKRFRKSIAVLLMLCLVFLLTACGGRQEAVENSSTLLQPSSSELPAAGSDVISDSITQTDPPNSGLPYFEIAFSAEEFIFAGYRVTDGERYEDVLQTVSEKLSPTPNYILESGWSYIPESEIFPDSISMVYFSTSNKTAFGDVTYKINDLTWAYDAPHIEISIGMNMQNEQFPAKEAPFLSSPVICGMEYEEVISILKLERLIESLKNGELTEKDPMTINNYYFESQYGKSSGSYIDTGEVVKVSVHTQTEKIAMDFEDGILRSFSYTGIYE